MCGGTGEAGRAARQTTPRQRLAARAGRRRCCARVVSDTLLPYLELASVATVYLAGVVYVALRLGQSAALLAVVGSIFAFDLMFVPPRWSLKPIDPQYYFTFLVMLVVGLLISRLAAHARLQASSPRRGRAVRTRSTSWPSQLVARSPTRTSPRRWRRRCDRRSASPRRCCCPTVAACCAMRGLLRARRRRR